MNKRTTQFNDEGSLRSVYPAKPVRLEYQVVAVQGAVLISRLIYAILIVGFVGYYLEKALQIVRQ